MKHAKQFGKSSPHKTGLIVFSLYSWIVVSANFPLCAQTTEGGQTDITSKQSRYSISKETTRVTGPIRDDGTIDILAAINHEFSKGITRENNAAATILPILPKSEYWSASERDSILTAIDSDLLPMDRPHLIGLKQYCNERTLDFDAFVNAFSEACDRPWTPDQFRHVYQWLETNQVAIDAIVEATQMPRYYVPLKIAKDGALLPDVNQPILSPIRQICRTLLCRAMLRIKSQQWDTAWSDILAVKRLAKHIGSQPTLVEGLVGIAIDSMACHAAKALMESAAAQSGINWADKLNQWSDKDPRVVNLARQIDLVERLMYVQLIARIADGNLTFTDALNRAITFGDERREKIASIDKIFESINEVGGLDWDAGLRWANTFYDRVAKSIEMNDPIERRKAFDELFQKLDELEKSFGLNSLLTLVGDGSRAAKAQQVCGIFLLLVGPAIQQVVAAELRARSYRTTIAAGLACLAYKDRHGSLPQSPDQVKKWLKKRPMLFTESINGEELKWTSDESNLILRFEHPHHQTLDFSVELNRDNHSP